VQEKGMLSGPQQSRNGMAQNSRRMTTIWTLPNALTIIRIILIPLFLILVLDRMYPEALCVFALGGLTDALDGAVARKTKQGTVLGSYLDPLADKLLIMSSYVALTGMDALPAWLTVLVLSRDLVILLGYGVLFMLIREKIEVQPTRIGKLSTGLQIVTVVLILIGLSGAQIQSLLPLFYLLTAATTVISGLHYIHRGMLWFRRRTASS
jgi:cardiolipin synthase